MQPAYTRREFLAASSMALLVAATRGGGSPVEDTPAAEPIIDIHQHTHYHARTDEALAAHQKAMGVTQTVLLPAGSRFGLAAEATGNQAVYDFAQNHPGEYVYFANEVVDLPEARETIEAWLKKGAIGIGEQKFHVDCDSPSMETIAGLAEEYKVPVLMHFEHKTYNMHIERFHKMLEKFPKVTFIGHAQTWWGNIDKNCDQKTLYPKGPVTAGGITDRLLSDYPNMFGDLSAGSGLNALTRDKDFTRDFFQRHQDKLLFGSDCEDTVGHGPACTGWMTISKVKELSPNKTIERKLLFDNAKKLLKL